MLIVVCLSLVVFGVGGFPGCQTTCGQGRYCLDTTCHPCPHQTFQDQMQHHDTQCKPWTEKPQESNYVTKKPGTDISDAVWECDVGYYERQYTLNGYECVRIRTTHPPSPPTTTKYPETSLKQMQDTSPSPAPIQDETDDNLVIILSIFVGILTVFITILCLFCCYRKRIFCFKNIKRKEQASKPEEMEPLTVTRNQYYDYFDKIINELEPDKADTFIKYLDDPSEKFRPDHVMKTERQKNNDPIIYRINTLVEWAVLNGKIDEEKVQKALKNTGYPDLLRQIKDQDTINPKLSPNRYQLYYYLVKNLKSDDAQTLLTQLPDGRNGFNAINTFNHKKSAEKKDFESAFGDTMEEWFDRNPSISLQDTILEILNNLDRNDILGNSDFKELMQNLTDTPV